MNRCSIIGNLTADPVLRATQTGISVCSFTVAVNRRKNSQTQNQEADFFNISAWRELGENCQKYLAKGRKVAVVGPVSIRTYNASDGTPRANLEIQAQEVEFLSPREQPDYQSAPQPAPRPAPKPAVQIDMQTGMQEVETDELPF